MKSSTISKHASKRNTPTHPYGRLRPGGLILGLCLTLTGLPGWGQTTHTSQQYLSPATADFDTQVWLTDMSARLERYIDDPTLRLEVARRVHYEARKVDLPPELVLAVIHTESTFDPEAISSAGALGLMQVMPFWKIIIGDKTDDLMNLHTNIRYGVTILQHYLEKENGNLTRALARYNGSLGKTWYPERVYANLERHWELN